MAKNILLILSLLLSCNIIKNDIEKKNKSVIFLKRTQCFGTCPVYEIEVFSNGHGIYTGYKFVKDIGVREFKLSTLQIEKILDYAKKIDFKNLKSEYSAAISDLPKTYVRINEKEILDYVGAPITLRKLEELIDSTYLESISDSSFQKTNE